MLKYFTKPGIFSPQKFKVIQDKYYITISARPLADMPVMTKNMEYMDIVHYVQKHWSMVYDTNGKGTPGNASTTYMVALSDRIFDPKNWKKPICSMYPKCGIHWVAACIVWYHGRDPMIKNQFVYSEGYACD